MLTTKILVKIITGNNTHKCSPSNLPWDNNIFRTTSNRINSINSSNSCSSRWLWISTSNNWRNGREKWFSNRISTISTLICHQISFITRIKMLSKFQWDIKDIKVTFIKEGHFIAVSIISRLRISTILRWIIKSFFKITKDIFSSISIILRWRLSISTETKTKVSNQIKYNQDMKISNISVNLYTCWTSKTTGKAWTVQLILPWKKTRRVKNSSWAKETKWITVKTCRTIRPSTSMITTIKETRNQIPLMTQVVPNQIQEVEDGEVINWPINKILWVKVILKITTTKAVTSKRIAQGLTTTTMDQCRREGPADITVRTAIIVDNPSSKSYRWFSQISINATMTHKKSGKS